MRNHEKKDFFLNIRRSISISHFIASVIPLGLLVYFSLKYIYPMFMKGTSELPIHIGALLFFAVLVSVLGLTLSIKTTNSSISSLQDLHRKLNSLFDVTKKIRETQYLDILLESIVQSAMKLNSAEAGSLLLYDETGNLKFRVALGERSKAIKEKTIQKGEGIAGWVAENAQSAIINDVTKDSRFNPAFDRESGFNTRSIMSVPLIHKKEVIGVIEVLNRENGVFVDEDEKLLYSLADQAAISIVHSKANEAQQSDMIQITSILVEAQDNFSLVKKGHARSVANYANLIGKQMGLAEKDLRKIYHASLFHDIGFMRLDINIPPKPEDMVKVKKHPQIGFDIIKPLSLWSDSADIILYHHERYDGAGYPEKKKGLEIPLGARIIFVADTFDVLTSNTSYRKQLTHQEAMGEIENHSGTQFDPAVVKAFISALKESDIIG
jgi:HD-GYP domain-containing protein (c-di-GMP phosphodiesterase class II)